LADVPLICIPTVLEEPVLFGQHPVQIRYRIPAGPIGCGDCNVQWLLHQEVEHQASDLMLVMELAASSSESDLPQMMGP
jgi:hypothetical protein